MKRRNLILTGTAAGVLAIGGPSSLLADPSNQLPTTTPKPKKKKIPPTHVPEVSKIMRGCEGKLARLCKTLLKDMNVVLAEYNHMIAEVRRRLKAGGLGKTEKANLKGMLNYLLKKHNELHIIATGNSAPGIRDSRAGDSFCETAAKYARIVAKTAKDYEKRGRSNRDKVADIKTARKNIRRATAAIEKAFETFIKKTRSHIPTLAKTRKAKGTNGIYTKRREQKIKAAWTRLMNGSGLVFKANEKERRLQTLSFKFYGKA